MRFAKWVATSIVCVYAFLISVHAQQAFMLGSVSAAPGTKAIGFLDVPVGSDAGTKLPVVATHGGKPGPVLTVASGSHGTEVGAIA